MKKYCNILVILLLVQACGSDRIVNAELDQVQSVMNEYPDSALQLIRSVDCRDVECLATKARYGVIYSQLLDKNHIDVKSDSLIRPAADYYMQHGSTHDKAQSLYYLGRVYDNADDEVRASDALVQAEVFSCAMKESDPFLRGLSCYAMATRYGNQGCREEALDYLRRGEAEFASVGSEVNVAQCCWRRAVIYYNMYDYASAMEPMFRAIELFGRHFPPEKIADMTGMGEVMKIVMDSTTDNRYKIVRLRARLDSDLSYNPVPEQIWLAYYYGQESNVDSARYFVTRMMDASTNDNDRLWGYEALYSLEKYVGNYKKALEYHEKKIELSEIYVKNKGFSSGLFLESRLRAEYLQLDLEALKGLQRYQLIIGGLLLLLSVVLGWLLVRGARIWRRRLHEQHEASLHQRDVLVGQMTETHDGLQSQYDVLLAKVNADANDDRMARFNEVVEMRLAGFRTLIDNAYRYKIKPDRLFRDFKKFAAVSPSAKKEVWADLRYVINKKHGGFVTYLQEHHPSLSAHDLDLCCLLCFGFSPQGICFIYDYEDVGSLYNKRCRLRHKLQLADGQKLEHFLTELCLKLTEQKEAEENRRDADTPMTANM